MYDLLPVQYYENGIRVCVVEHFCFQRKSRQTAITHKFIGSASKASGFLMIVICKFFVSIKLSCLHFGQYKGKFLSMVSILSQLRVLFPHLGQSIHSGVITIYLPLCFAFFFSCRKAYWRSFSASRCSRLFVFLSSLFCSCCNFSAC